MGLQPKREWSTRIKKSPNIDVYKIKKFHKKIVSRTWQIFSYVGFSMKYECIQDLTVHTSTVTVVLVPVPIY